MEHRLIQTGVDELLPMQGRSEGMHISTIMGDMLTKMRVFGDGQFGDGSSAFELGNAFEDAVIEALAKRYAKSNPDKYLLIGEQEAEAPDGSPVFGTPDLFDLEEYAVIEIKLAWMSAKQDPTTDKFWRYLVQLKAYCHMVGTCLGHIHVCHINGNYADIRGPIYNVWELVFDQSELEENWLMLMTHMESMDDSNSTEKKI